METSVNNSNWLYSSKDSDETRTIYTKSDNIGIMISNETD